jgi:hypothetical protein
MVSQATDLSSTRSRNSREETYASTQYPHYPCIFPQLHSTTEVACLWCRVLMLGLAIQVYCTMGDLYILNIVVGARFWGQFGRIGKLQRNGRMRNCHRSVGHAVILVSYVRSKVTSFLPFSSAVLNRSIKIDSAVVVWHRLGGRGRIFGWEVGAWALAPIRMSCIFCGRSQKNLFHTNLGAVPRYLLEMHAVISACTQCTRLCEHLSMLNSCW